jgi:hypothetical protein
LRKKALLMVAWFLLSTWSAAMLVTAGPNDEAALDSTAVFTLPASLKVIEDEAFEGVSAETVILSDSTESIGARAFADNGALKAVHVSESLFYIGDNAFEGSYRVMIVGSEGSYAAAWARMHNVAFMPEETSTTWLVKLGRLLQEGFFLSFSLGCIFPEAQFWQRRKREVFERSMRPQDRPELHPINYRFP